MAGSEKKADIIVTPDPIHLHIILNLVPTMKTPQSLLCVLTLLILSLSDAKSIVRRNGQTRGHVRNSLADGRREIQAINGPGDNPTFGGKGGPKHGPPDGGTPVPDAGASSTVPNEDGGQQDSSRPGSSQNPMTSTSGPTFAPSSPAPSPAASPLTQPPQPPQTLAPSISNPSPQLPDATDSHQMDTGCDDVTTESTRVNYSYELVTRADSSWYNVANFLETAIQEFLTTSLVTCDGTSTPVGNVRGISASGLNQVTGDACTGITVYDPVLLSCHVMNGTMIVHLSPASTMTEEEIRNQVWDTLRVDFNSDRRRRLGSSLINSDAGIIELYFLSQEDPSMEPLNGGSGQFSSAQSTNSGVELGPAVSAGLVGVSIFLLAIIGFVYVKRRGAGKSKTGRSLWPSSEMEDGSATLEQESIAEPGALDCGFDDGSVSSIEIPQFSPSSENEFGHEQLWSTNEQCRSHDHSSTSMSSSRLGKGRKKAHGSFSENTTSSTVAEQWERGATIKHVSDGDDSPTRIYAVAEGDTVDF